MRPKSLMCRLTVATAVAGLMLGPGLAPSAPAQTPPSTPLAADQQADQEATTPPERAGRLWQITGEVSFHTADQDQWSAAAPNYPVATGDAFWTEPNATAWLEISASRIAMAGGTELDVDNLDQNGLQATLPQGETYLHLQDLAPSEIWSVQTPRGMVTFSGAGRYGMVAGDTQSPTLITVLEGAAQLNGPGFSLEVSPGQTVTITGTDTFQASIGPARADAFLTAMQQAERPPPSVAVPSAVAEMPGGYDLAAYGTWTQTPDYGEVWYPPVAAGWVPYREGHWAWVEPWGWTWIDDEPWGFAPFHYGRWAEIQGRWAWTPSVVQVAAPPVYAPALVTFIGIGAAAGTAVALESGRVGWFPLGPHEPYHPWYHAPETYVRALNRRDVTNLTVINPHNTINNFGNRPGLTVIPALAMAESRPVRQAAERVDPHMLAAARPVVGTAPIRPTVATAGVTPELAKRLHLPASAAGTRAVVRVAPGPALRSMPHVHGPATRPPLRAATQRNGNQPQQGVRPASEAQPPLQQPVGQHTAPNAAVPERRAIPEQHPAPAVHPETAPHPTEVHQPAEHHAAPEPHVVAPHPEPPRPAPALHPDTAPHPEPHPAPHPEPHPAPRPEPHPVPHFEPHPAPRPEPGGRPSHPAPAEHDHRPDQH